MNVDISTTKDTGSTGSTTGIWLNNIERAQLSILAKNANTSLGSFIKKQALRKPIIKHRADPAVVLAVNRMGNNINQIARWLNTAKSLSAMERIELLTALAAINNETKSLC